MSEEISKEYGYRRPDGKVVGWTRTKSERDRWASVALSDAKKLGVKDYRLTLLTRTRTVSVGHPQAERTVAA